MKKVLLVQPILSHYRQSLFELLVNDSRLQFVVIAGKELNGIKVFKSNSKKINAILKNKSFSLMGRKFYYQVGLFNAIKKKNPTDIIFGGPDFHFITTIILSLYLFLFTKIRVHYWTHGISKTNSIISKKSLAFFYNNASSILTYEKNGKDLISKITNNKNIFVVKNSLNYSDYGFNKNQILRKQTKNFLILFSGRLIRNKKVDVLINAIKLLADQDIPLVCNIIGNGEHKNELMILTNKLGLQDKINFVGAKYGDEVDNYFLSSDAFVLPGKVGLSIIHALSYGLPVITTSLPIHSPESAILKNDHNAFFYNDLCPIDLAKVLKKSYNLIKIKEVDYKDICVNSVIENGYLPNNMKETFINGLI